MVSEAWPSINATRAAVRSESRSDLDDAASLGIVVHPLTSAQRNQWRVATADVTEQLIKKIGGRSREVYERIQEVRENYQREEPTPH